MQCLKQELAAMFKNLEKSIKREMTAVHTDLNRLLSCVEDNEQRQDDQEEVIKDLQEKVEKLRIAQRAATYKMKDLKNRNRRNNLCLRGIPETVKDEKLQIVVQKILNPILGQPETNAIHFDRIHRVQRPRNVALELPHDVICRLHYFEEKNTIMKKMRQTANANFEGSPILVCSDLLKETLDCRWALRPFLEKLRAADITYHWGFPICLVAIKDGDSVTL